MLKRIPTLGRELNPLARILPTRSSTIELPRRLFHADWDPLIQCFFKAFHLGIRKNARNFGENDGGQSAKEFLLLVEQLQQHQHRHQQCTAESTQWPSNTTNRPN